MGQCSGKKAVGAKPTNWFEQKINQKNVDFTNFEFVIDEDDVDLGFAKKSEKFLNEYSKEDCEKLFEVSGVRKVMEDKGLMPMVLSMDTDDNFVHTLFLYCHNEIHRPDHCCTQLAISKGPGKMRIKSLKTFEESKYKTLGLDTFEEEGRKLMVNVLHSTIDAITIRWLLSQNPHVQFTGTETHLEGPRPQMPGQKHPGLGVAKLLLKTIFGISKEKGRDCVVNIPEHFHNAALYSIKGCFFINPFFEGLFQTMVRDLTPDIEHMGMAAVSYAFKEGKIKDQEGRVMFWHPQEMVFPLSKRMKEFVKSKEYTDVVQAVMESGLGVCVDWDQPLFRREPRVRTMDKIDKDAIPWQNTREMTMTEESC
eukprot:TRINITY_DN778209_c0_g1_i1.p1 TRINITY_DN778209_c0_g1~~TRINITY_DN778209_c0_g1_i1.p1  ORF type:complete len:366 (-),score=72.15 TRINITY_DN778209_c0_g1_i1:506-1603(-)